MSETIIVVHRKDGTTYTRRAKRSVEYTSPWEGMESMERYISMCPTQDHVDLLVGLFLTGCRRNEVILLKPRMFRVEGELLKGYEVPVLKHYRRDARTVQIEISNPLTPLLLDLINRAREKEWAWLYPARKRFGGGIIEPVIKHISSSQVYKMIEQISPEIFPHWARSQRAKFLKMQYGFNTAKLQTWFKWKNADIPLRYTHESEEEVANYMREKQATITSYL